MNKIYDVLIFPARYAPSVSFTFFFLASVGMLLTGCNKEPSTNDTQQERVQHLEPGFTRYQYTQLHLGVQVRIVLFAEKEVSAIEAATSAYAKIATLENIFSSYRLDSELNRLTKNALYEPAFVSNDMFYVLEFAQSLAQKTNGAFDITLGPYISLWKNTKKTKKLPDIVALESATHSVGWQLIELNLQNRSVTLRQKGMQLNMGGIAKGYILDEAMNVLTELGISSALIEAGGDIVVSGAPPETKGWNIEVPGVNSDHPIAARAKNLSFAAISTSGDTEQFIDIDGIRYSHVIDPKTGLGSTRRDLVTIIAPSGLKSDSYATALSVMSEQERQEFLETHLDVIAYIRNSPY